nr:MAG TPA: hypothetical protein [Caudoviricetes sp.]
MAKPASKICPAIQAPQHERSGHILEDSGLQQGGNGEACL